MKNININFKNNRGEDVEHLKNLSENYQWVDKISNKVIIEIVKTNDMLTEVHDRFFSKYGISNARFNVLVLLYKGPEEGIQLSRIREQMLVSSANITGLIDTLEKQKLVERMRSKKDRRKILAKITDLGKETIEKVIENYIIWSNNVMEILENKEKEELLRLLKKLEQGVIQMETEI